MKGSPNYTLAITLILRGDPLPVDLIARLLDEGYDVSEMERLHS